MNFLNLQKNLDKFSAELLEEFTEELLGEFPEILLK